MAVKKLKGISNLPLRSSEGEVFDSSSKKWRSGKTHDAIIGRQKLQDRQVAPLKNRTGNFNVPQRQSLPVREQTDLSAKARKKKSKVIGRLA